MKELISKENEIFEVRKFLFIGDIKKVYGNLNNLNKIVNSKNFIDSFKGVFLEKKFDIDIIQVKRISELKEKE